MLAAVRRRLIQAAPTITAISLMSGNLGFLLRRGFHPNLETAVGFLWIASDYALRQKPRHPIAAPRLNAAGVILGSLLLSLTGLLATPIDWHRVRTPLGYIPGSAVVGLQHELRRIGERLAASHITIAKLIGAALQHPYTLSALLCSYGAIELMLSALHAHDKGLIAISIAYITGTAFLALFDYGPQGERTHA
ncbi:MAG TPA: hypothetical protein VIM67_08650 [Terriglobus sp.]